MRHREGVLKTEHGILPGLKEILLELSDIEEVNSIVPGRIYTTRPTEAAQVASESQAVERLEQCVPGPPHGPAVQLVSVDGTMVPLVGGIWAKANTRSIGTVQPDPADSTWVHTEALSYFSRLSDAESFTRLATLETQPRWPSRSWSWWMGPSGVSASSITNSRMRCASWTSRMRWDI